MGRGRQGSITLTVRCGVHILVRHQMKLSVMSVGETQLRAGFRNRPPYGYGLANGPPPNQILGCRIKPHKQDAKQAQGRTEQRSLSLRCSCLPGFVHCRCSAVPVSHPVRSQHQIHGHDANANQRMNVLAFARRYICCCAPVLVASDIPQSCSFQHRQISTTPKWPSQQTRRCLGAHRCRVILHDQRRPSILPYRV